MKISDIEVEYKRHVGSDLEVVNAARVSFDKESEWDSVEYTTCKCAAYHSVDCICGAWDAPPRYFLSDKDKSLISYLAKHNHWSPFSHCFVTFRIKAPLFVARQLQKHTVGLAWNEVSRRYVASAPEFYMPEALRSKAENVKQGSGDSLDDKIASFLLNEMKIHTNDCIVMYNCLLANGVAPEQARMVLPQNMMTEWIWSGSLYAFARVCKLRLDAHAQKEARDVAAPIAAKMNELFPVSWKALMEN